jgi:hypothetical protein
MIPGRDVTPSRRLGLCAAFIVTDSARQKLAYVYFEDEPGRLISSSTARAKGAIGRLDFHFTLVLRARGEPECAAGGLNNSAARPLV